jgi:hypothetical protein
MSMMMFLSPEVFLFELRTALAHPPQKEKFINRKTTGEPARSQYHWRSMERQFCVSDLTSISYPRANAQARFSARPKNDCNILFTFFGSDVNGPCPFTESKRKSSKTVVFYERLGLHMNGIRSNASLALPANNEILFGWLGDQGDITFQMCRNNLDNLS